MNKGQLQQMADILKDIVPIAARLRAERYPGSAVAFLAGSHVRGEATATSDLDIVVVFDHLPCAYRDSFCYETWPVEVFAHDPQTLAYFFQEIDRRTGVPSLASMVAEGIEIPASTDFSKSLKQFARSSLQAGPPAWSDEDRAASRYAITNLLDDLKEPRTNHEALAILTSLYPALADHYFRTRNLWSASGKSIARALLSHDGDFATRFLDGFEAAFAGNGPASIIDLATEILQRDGGFLFEGYRLDAPTSWRKDP